MQVKYICLHFGSSLFTHKKLLLVLTLNRKKMHIRKQTSQARLTFIARSFRVRSKELLRQLISTQLQKVILPITDMQIFSQNFFASRPTMTGHLQTDCPPPQALLKILLFGQSLNPNFLPQEIILLCFSQEFSTYTYFKI